MSVLNNYFKQAEGLNHTAEKSKKWLEQHKVITSELNNSLIGFNELPFAIQIFGGTGDKYTEIHPWHHLLFEAEQDLDSAILLMLTGFYKDSFRSLRSFLELHIFALYHFVNEDNHNFQEWLQGRAYTPKISNLLQALSEKKTDIQALNKKLQWDKEVKVLYKELSGFMHTQGAAHTHTSLRNSNLTTFSEIGIKAGTNFLLKAIRLAAMGFVVNFPMSFQPLPLFDKFAFNQPAGGFLDEGQVERVRAIFPDDVTKMLSEICMSNEATQSWADSIESLPDLSEEEVFKSLKNTIESDEFANSKEEILQLIKDDKIREAFAYVQAIQRAVTRTMTMVLFNPFHGVSDRGEG